jgi:hypothetical protein
MKNIIPLLLLLLTLPTQAEVISRNLVGTAADISITQEYQQETGEGELQVKLCSSCTSYDLTLTTNTKVSRYNKTIEPSMLETYLNEKRTAPMRLQFNKNTNEIISIMLRHNNEEYLP